MIKTNGFPSGRFTIRRRKSFKVSALSGSKLSSSRSFQGIHYVLGIELSAGDTVTCIVQKANCRKARSNNQTGRKRAWCLTTRNSVDGSRTEEAAGG